MIKCTVCTTENPEFSLRCSSCGGLLQQSTKTLDLFSTIYNLWRFPDFVFRKIMLAEHGNYTLLIAIFESIGFSFLSLFIIKAGDIFSIELPRLLWAGFAAALTVYFPFLFLFSALSYTSTRVSKTGARLKGFTTGMIYGLHPIALSAIIVLPIEIAVFGPYIFSNNPSPLVINPVPFYFLGSLDFFLGIASVVFVLRLAKLLFGSRKKAAIFAGIFFILLITSMEITKRVLVK